MHLLRIEIDASFGGFIKWSKRNAQHGDLLTRRIRYNQRMIQKPTNIHRFHYIISLLYCKKSNTRLGKSNKQSQKYEKILSCEKLRAISRIWLRIWMKIHIYRLIQIFVENNGMKFFLYILVKVLTVFVYKCALYFF